MICVAYVDGASRGNPGPASIGVSLQNDGGEEVDFVSERIGNTTNNEAEYRALIAALQLAKKKKAKTVEIRADSELVVRQMSGKYKVKHPKLRALWVEAQELSKSFESFAIHHVPREENARADELANQALDKIPL